jgi:hypothetical protein
MRSALIEAERIVDEQARCEECGYMAWALPGDSYGPQARALFKDLEALLSEARLSPLRAIELSGELASKSSQPGSGLLRLIQLLPSLAILELIVGSEPMMVRQAESMLASLLRAIAMGRSRSGMMSAIEAPTGQRTTKRGGT